MKWMCESLYMIIVSFYFTPNLLVDPWRQCRDWQWTYQWTSHLSLQSRLHRVWWLTVFCSCQENMQGYFVSP